MTSQTPPGTPERTPRLPREARRAQLLDAATEVFATRGYYSSSMDDIAVAAGVSKPVLYQHFASKLELYLALVDQACGELTAHVTRALASSDRGGDRVVATMAAFYNYVCGSSRQFRFVFESDLTGEPQVRERIFQAHDELSDAIAEVITTDTDLAADSAKLLGISLVGIAEVSARYWVRNSPGEGLTLAQATELVSTLAWRGIGGFPRREGDEPPDQA